MKQILKLNWTASRESKRAKCALHNRPLFKITDGVEVKYRCANINCKNSNEAMI